MALFGRNRHDPVGQVAQGPIGPAGWSALPPGQVPFERDFTRGVDLINWSRHWKSLTAQTNAAVPATSFRDCYSTLLAGRPVTIANGWTRLGSTTFSAGEPSGCSVVAVQLPALVPLVSIRPQRFPDYLGKPTLYTGILVFDGRFAVCGDPGARKRSSTPPFGKGSWRMTTGSRPSRRGTPPGASATTFSTPRMRHRRASQK